MTPITYVPAEFTAWINFVQKYAPVTQADQQILWKWFRAGVR